MRVVELRVENHKRLKVVAVRPDGPLVVIAGNNSAGKSSVLNAIVTALAGITVAGPTPIREGEEKSSIRLDLGELVVTRSFKRGTDGEITTKLVLTNADGSKPPGTPQAILNALLGNLTFDPLSFGKMKVKEQFDAVRQLVPGFDFDAYDAAQKKDYDERTNQNRIAGEHSAAAAKIALPPGPKPEKVVVADVLAEIEAAQRHNMERDERQRRRTAAEEEAERDRDQAEKLRAQAASLEKHADELETKLAAAPPLPEFIDVTPMRERLSAAEAINTTVRAHEARDSYELQAQTAKMKSATLTAGMKAREDAKVAATAAAKMPIAGLDLRDGEVKFNGLPIASAGTSEQIKVGMAVAAALNPKLRVILVDEGSEIDRDNLKVVHDFAAERDLQIWMTRCSTDSGMPELEIVDGEIARETKA